MKNKAIDLHNILIEQLEILSDPDLTGEKLKEAISRGKTIAQVATAIVENKKVVVDAYRLVSNGMVRQEDLPEYFTGKPQLKAN